MFAARRPVRLSDMDVHGRLRLDAVARYLQDVAIDDVGETGWGAPEHLWVVRRYEVDVVAPFLYDEWVELTTWCSGLAPVAAGRRTTLLGDAGGRIEVESAWIHLGPDGRPARLDAGFGIYADATGGRRVSTRLELPDPPMDADRAAWQLRSTDVDRMGHLNNAVHWQAIEHRLLGSRIDARLPFRAVLEYRGSIDLGDEVELAGWPLDGGTALGFVVAGVAQAVAWVTQPKLRSPH